MSSDLHYAQTKFSLTNFQLKIIALVTMIIDHAGMIFQGYNDWDLSWMRLIGRISFPIFAFLISEGCRHTKNMKKYMLRLLIFAVIIHLAFALKDVLAYFLSTDLGSFGFLPNLNIFFTLFFGVTSVFFYEKIDGISNLPDSSLQKYILRLLPFVLIVIAAELLGADYGGLGVFMIFIIYTARSKAMRLQNMFIAVLFLYFSCLSPSNFRALLAGEDLTFLMPFFAMISLLFVSFYNGEKGRSWKWFFYFAYPAHFIILLGLYFSLTL